MAGVRYDTPLDVACDVLFLCEVEGVPRKEMTEWRQSLDRQLDKLKTPDRDTWGMQPDQLAKMGKLTGGFKGPTRAGFTAVEPPRGGLKKE